MRSRFIPVILVSYHWRWLNKILVLICEGQLWVSLSSAAARQLSCVRRPADSETLETSSWSRIRVSRQCPDGGMDHAQTEKTSGEAWGVQKKKWSESFWEQKCSILLQNTAVVIDQIFRIELTQSKPKHWFRRSVTYLYYLFLFILSLKCRNLYRVKHCWARWLAWSQYLLGILDIKLQKLHRLNF